MATKKQNKKAPVIQPMSIQEFKIWIKGLSAFQADDWFPNKAQWEHIMQLIDNLQYAQVQAVTVSTPYYPSDEDILKASTGTTTTTTTTTGGTEAPIVKQPPAPRFLGQPSTTTATKSQIDPITNSVIQEPHSGKSSFI